MSSVSYNNFLISFYFSFRNNGIECTVIYNSFGLNFTILPNIGSTLIIKHCSWSFNGSIRFPLFWTTSKLQQKEKGSFYNEFQENLNESSSYFWRNPKKLMAKKAFWVNGNIGNKNLNRKLFLINLSIHLGFHLFDQFQFIQISDIQFYGGSKLLSDEISLYSLFLDVFPFHNWNSFIK